MCQLQIVSECHLLNLLLSKSGNVFIFLLNEPCYTSEHVILFITMLTNFHLIYAVHVVLVIFVYLVYTASSHLGSPKTVYNHLIEVASKSRVCREPISHKGQACGPVSGNYKGTYLTMLSSDGLVFGIINIVGNFGTVFVDNVSNIIKHFCYTNNLFIFLAICTYFADTNLL